MLDSCLALAGIAVPALVLFLVLRRLEISIEPRIAAQFLAISVAFVGPGLLPDRITVPVDEVARGYPYRGVVGEVTPKNPLTNDTAKLFLPWHQVVREELAAGRLPLWNRYSFSGYPLLGNGESAPFSPFFVATIFVPLPKQMVAMAGLKIFVALLFAYLAARQRGLSAWAACFASAAFSLSVYQTVYLNYSAATVSALAPAALFALTLAVESRTRRACFLVSAVVASLLAAGHPESVLHVAVGCGVVLAGDALFCADRRSWLRGFGMACAGALLGLAVAAPAWIPVLEQVLQSARFAELASHREMTEPFRVAAAWALLSPDAFGNPAHGNWSWIYNYSVVASSYAGLVTLCFLPAALGRGVPRRILWLALSATALFLVCMDWTWLGVLNDVPPLSLVANDKMRFMVVLLAAIAVGGVLDHLNRGAIAIALCSTAVAGWLLVELFRQHYGSHFGAWALLAPAGLAVVWLAIAASGAARARVVIVAFCATLAELFAFNVPFNAAVDEKYFVPRLPIVERLRAIAPREPFRIAGHDWVFLPNNSAQYGLEDIRGSDPMAWAPYVEFLKLVTIDTPGADVRRVVDAGLPAIDFLNVRYLFTEPGYEAPGGWTLRYEGADGRLFENEEALPRFFAPERLQHGAGERCCAELGRIADFRSVAVIEEAGGGRTDSNEGLQSIWLEQTRPTRFRLTLDASRPVLIASSQPATPGWKVIVNGEASTLVRTNGAFIGFRVPAGRSKVVVEYAPTSFRASCVIALLALGGMIATSIRRRTIDRSVPG
ncbi:MAG: YfhO family protein [Thermoanaerobaculia bacterium]|nr:YfhO family protein [Thermoanaerobaculia bacterium]